MIFRLNEHLDDASNHKKEELAVLPPVISNRIDSKLLGSVVNSIEKDDSIETPPADPIHSTDETSEIEDVQKSPNNETNDLETESNAETIKI